MKSGRRGEPALVLSVPLDALKWPDGVAVAAAVAEL